MSARAKIAICNYYTLAFKTRPAVCTSRVQFEASKVLPTGTLTTNLETSTCEILSDVLRKNNEMRPTISHLYHRSSKIVIRFMRYTPREHEEKAAHQGTESRYTHVHGGPRTTPSKLCLPSCVALCYDCNSDILLVIYGKISSDLCYIHLPDFTLALVQLPHITE